MLPVEEMKSIWIFGEESQKEQLIKKLDKLGHRRKHLPYDPQVYIETIFNTLLRNSFSGREIVNVDFYYNTDKNKRYPYLKEIGEVLANSHGLRLIDAFPDLLLSKWRHYEQMKEVGVQEKKEKLKAKLKESLMIRIELVMIEIAKEAPNVEIWVPLDARVDRMDATVSGHSNEGIDYTLRELYYQRAFIKAKIVFWENGERVIAPWERNPIQWQACQKNYIEEIDEVMSIGKQIVIYGLPKEGNLLRKSQLLQTSLQEGVKIDLASYLNDRITDAIFESMGNIKNKEESKHFFDHWLRAIQNRGRYPLLKKYYHISQEQEKLQLKRIFDPDDFEKHKTYTIEHVKKEFEKQGHRIGLELAAADPKVFIYFPLDNLDMFKVVNKKDDPSSLASDLRYLYRHWDRLKEKVVFTRKNQLAKVPWETAPKLWERYVRKSEINGTSFGNSPQTENIGAQKGIDEKIGEPNQTLKTLINQATIQKKQTSSQGGKSELTNRMVEDTLKLTKEKTQKEVTDEVLVLVHGEDYNKRKTYSDQKRENPLIQNKKIKFEHVSRYVREIVEHIETEFQRRREDKSSRLNGTEEESYEGARVDRHIYRECSPQFNWIPQSGKLQLMNDFHAIIQKYGEVGELSFRHAFVRIGVKGETSLKGTLTKIVEELIIKIIVEYAKENKHVQLLAFYDPENKLALEIVQGGIIEVDTIIDVGRSWAKDTIKSAKTYPLRECEEGQLLRYLYHTINDLPNQVTFFNRDKELSTRAPWEDKELSATWKTCKKNSLNDRSAFQKETSEYKESTNVRSKPQEETSQIHEKKPSVSETSLQTEAAHGRLLRQVNCQKQPNIDGKYNLAEVIAQLKKATPRSSFAQTKAKGEVVQQEK